MKKLLFASVALFAIPLAAQAADLPAAAPAYKAPVIAPAVFSWTGFYIGLNVGGKWATTSGTVDETAVAVPGAATFPAASLPIGTTSSTVIGGGQVGYNWQTGPLVLGIEGDIDAQSWTHTNTVNAFFPPGTFNFVPGDNFTINSKWEASLRGRLGFAWDRVLLYATGGVAWTGVTVGTNFTAFTNGGVTTTATSASDQQTLTGATAGGGLEYAVTNNVILGVEGRYTWYGSHTFNGGVVNVLGNVNSPVSQTIKLDTAEVLGKINFKF